MININHKLNLYGFAYKKYADIVRFFVLWVAMKNFVASSR